MWLIKLKNRPTHLVGIGGITGGFCGVGVTGTGTGHTGPGGHTGTHITTCGT